MKILFYSDGSSQAENAVRFGAPIAAACQAEVTLLGITGQDDQKKTLLRALGHARDILTEHRLSPELILKVGRPGHELFKHTREIHYDLLVLGGMHRNPLWRVLDPLWTSVRAFKITVPVEPHVLLVMGHRPALRRILLSTNGAASFDQAVEFAGHLARKVKAVVDLFHVMPQMPTIYTELIRLEEHVPRMLRSNSQLGRTLRRQKDLLEHSGVFGELRLRHGLVVPELLKELQQRDYDLVVSGSSPAKERLRKFVLGDVTREIVNRAGLPVLIMRTGQQTFWGLFKELLPHPFQRSPKTSGGPTG